MAIYPSENAPKTDIKSNNLAESNMARAVNVPHIEDMKLMFAWGLGEVNVGVDVWEYVVGIGS